MEEVDNIIVNSLRECGCDFVDDVSSIAEFSTENVVEATVRCLKMINPDLKLSHSLPPGMSARFRIGSTLAQACQSAGYRSDIGYQTFLYSNEADIRRLFMFLVEKLPRKKDESVEQTTDKDSTLRRNVSRVLKTQLTSIWLPPYCKRHGLRWSGNSYSIEGAKGTTSFITDQLTVPQGVGHKDKPISKELHDYYRDKLPFVMDQLSNHSNLIPSLIERNISELSRQQDWEDDLNAGTMRSKLSPEQYRLKELERLERSIQNGDFQLNHKKRKADENDETTIAGISLNSSFSEVINLISSQSTNLGSPEMTVDISMDETTKSFKIIDKKSDGLLKNNKKITSDKLSAEDDSEDMIVENHVGEDTLIEETPQETESEMIERVGKELKTELKDVIEKMERMEMEVHKFQESIVKAKEDLIYCEESNKSVQEKVKLQKKTLQLLPDAEENIAKLEAMVEANKQKMINLGQQWDKHRIPLLDKYEELKEKSSQRETQSERKMKEVKLVRQRIKENTEEMKRKEQLEKELTTQYGDMTRDVSRKSYTKRIFEIVANIRKQKQEIEKVLADMRSLQKEINQLEGRVERTFTAADEAIFKDAKKDDSVRQAYKYLASLNINCSQLLQTVDKTGEVMREIRDLEEQIANESKKNTASNLDKITDDFKEMKKENSEMIKKLKSMTSSSPKPRKKKS
ncbi:coiled-coil domain-containing protein 22-like [Styela clava]